MLSPAVCYGCWYCCCCCSPAGCNALLCALVSASFPIPFFANVRRHRRCCHPTSAQLRAVFFFYIFLNHLTRLPGGWLHHRHHHHHHLHHQQQPASQLASHPVQQAGSVNSQWWSFVLPLSNEPVEFAHASSSERNCVSSSATSSRCSCCCRCCCCYRCCGVCQYI